MAGFPQLREAAWLYAPDDPWTPLASVRLLERMDGTGWEVRVADPAWEPTQTLPFPDEAAARAEVASRYVAGERHGEWRIRQVEPY